MIKKLKFDIDKYKFRELVSEAFGVDDLEKLHELKKNWIKDEYKKLNVHNENTTKFHEAFYKKLNDNWTEFYNTYDNFIYNEIVPLFDKKFHY